MNCAQALDAARRETISTLIDIKVLPKTMVHSYGSWWNVGVAQTALSERIRKAAEMINENAPKRGITKTERSP